MQAYSDPEREHEKGSLPDLDIFRLARHECELCEEPPWFEDPVTGLFEHAPKACPTCGSDVVYHAPAWFWQSCFPGCLPDSDPVGPFKTEAEALADARGE